MADLRAFQRKLECASADVAESLARYKAHCAERAETEVEVEEAQVQKHAYSSQLGQVGSLAPRAHVVGRISTSSRCCLGAGGQRGSEAS